MTVSTATKARSNRSSKAATAAAVTPEVAPVETAPVEPTIEEQIMEVKQNWMLANDQEKAGKEGVKAAKLALDTVRVLKTRVAFHAAMIGSKAINGAPSLAGATRVLYCTADMDAAAQKKEIGNKKASVKLYWAAAQALDAEGLAYETGAPTDREREIVLTAFRAGKKSGPRVDDGAGNSDSEGESESKTEARDITADSFLPHIAGLNMTLTEVKAKKIPVSEGQVADMVAMLKVFTEQLSAYVAG